jgi:hypothetical protein
LQLDRRAAAALGAALCAMSLIAVLAGASSAGGEDPSTLPGGCASMPSWIATATLQDEAQDPLPSCFSAESSQAEGVLSVANNRPYAQLLTVAGGPLDLAESSFGDPLAASLSALLLDLSPAAGPSAFLLGPGQSATLAIDRPAPGPGQEIHVAAAGDNAFAVAAVAFRFLSAAAARRLLNAATRSCVASVLHGALQRPPRPERALRRVHACVNAANLPAGAETLLRRLASRLLRDDFFQSVIRRQGTEPRPAGFALAIAASNPELINPEIRLGPASFGTVTAGSRTVEHLSATGGVPPYRFYTVPEAGGPGVPAWLKLSAAGRLTLEPPAGTTAVTLPVEVVDGTGEHSVVAY